MICRYVKVSGERIGRAVGGRSFSFVDIMYDIIIVLFSGKGYNKCTMVMYLVLERALSL